MQSQKRDQQAQMLKSYRYLYLRIKDFYREGNFAQLDLFLKQSDILQRLSQGLLNFKAPSPDGASKKKLDDQTNPIKWGSVQPITQIQKDALVMKFSSSLNLDEMISFDLLDSYFVTNDESKKQFSYLNQVEQNINILNQELQQALQQLNYDPQRKQLASQNFTTMIRKWESELINVVGQILDNAYVVYFEERKSIFDILSLIMEYKYRFPQTKVFDTLTQQDLPENLIKSLEQNAKQFSIWSKFTKDPKDIIVKLQREEIQIQQCLLQYFKNHQVPNLTQIMRVLNYFIHNEFSGYVYKEKSFGFQFNQDQDVIQQRIVIQSLSLLNGINLFQPNLFVELELNNKENTKKYLHQLLNQPEQFRQLGDIFQNMEINEITACIYLVFRQIIHLLRVEKIQRDMSLKHDQIQLVVNIQVNRSVEQAQDEIVGSTSSAFIEKIIMINRMQKINFNLFHDRKGDINHIIQNWLNLIYPYLIEHRMQQSLYQAQQLAFEIFKDPIQLKRTWGLIDKTENLIGKQQPLGSPQRKNRYHSLDIFEEVLQDPIERLGDFCLIFSNLCGDKQHKYAENVIELLMKYDARQLDQKYRQKFGNKSILQILLIIFESRTTMVQDLSTENYNSYLNLCYLIGKIVSQDPLQYENLNNQLLAVQFQDKKEKVQHLRGFQDLNNYLISEPVLQTIIEAIQKLSNQSYAETTYTIRILIKAVSKIYKHLNLANEILMHFQFYEIESELKYHFIYFYKSQLDEYEYQIGKYKNTEVVLKLMNQMFQKNFPQGSLIRYKRTEIGSSILIKMLANIYYPLILNFFQLNFSDVKHFVNLTYRLLKLTKTMLDKYRDINPHFKLSISHRLPQFNQLLIYFNEIFNVTHVENIIQQVLLVAEDEIEGKSTGIQNKYWIEVLRKGPVSAKHHKQFKKLITTALQCYNTLLELTYINNQAMTLSSEKQEQIGARTYSLINLNLVKNIQSLMNSPGQGSTLQIERKNNSHLNYSIFNVIQYYVRPSASLNKGISQINEEAVKFVLNCCNIWAIPSNRLPVNLQSLLKYTGIIQKEIREQYALNFIEATKNLTQPLQAHYLISFLDLMIVSASSQTSFVEDLFKEEPFKQCFIDFVGKLLPSQRVSDVQELLIKDVMSKAIIFLAELSNSRICSDVLKEIVDQDFLIKIFQQIIVQRFLPDLNKKIDYTYQSTIFVDPFNKLEQEQENIQNVKNVYSANLGLITLKYFIRLVQDEYSRDINNKFVKSVIKNLFDHQALFNDLRSFINPDKVYLELNNLNTKMANGHNCRDEQAAKQMELWAISNPLISPQHLTFMEGSRIKSDDTTVRINNLEASGLFAYFKTIPNMNHLIQQKVFDREVIGKLGAQFLINTDELIEVVRTYYYIELNFIENLKAHAAMYNMIVSYLLCYNQVIDTIRNFILSVGKTRTRQNLRNKDFILKDRVVNTSLFALVESGDPKDYINNENAVKGIQNKLANRMINIAINLIHQDSFNDYRELPNVNQEMDQQFFPKLSVQVKQFETDIDYLTVILGIINNLSTISQLSADNINLLKSLQQFKSKLLQIRKLQVYNILQFDGVQMLRTEYEQQSARQYANLVLQVFSIENMIKNSERLIIQSDEIDMEYIYIISSVLEILNEKSCFNPSIQVINLGSSLISNEKLIQYFRRSQNNPLHLIIQKLNNVNTNVQDCAKIIEFLITFAEIDQGAELLNDSNILLSSSIGSVVSKLGQQNLYIQDTVELKRNPLHILWCYILLLIRTLNQKLVRDNNYKRSISAQLKLFQGRIPNILEIGSSIIHSDIQSISNNKSKVSLAMFEELELLTGCFGQIMEIIENLDQTDFMIFEQVKDRYLFSVIHLFSINFRVKQVSATEQYFNGILLDKIKENLMPITGSGGSSAILDKTNYTGFDILVHTQMIKTYINMNSAMLNVMLFDQKLQDERSFVNTWDRPNNYASFYHTTPRRGKEHEGLSISHSNRTFQAQIFGDREIEQFKGLDFIISALINYNNSLRDQNKMFRLFVSNEASLKEFYENIFAYYNNDEWINNEMLGFNNYLCGTSFDDLLKQFECAMQSGYLVSTLLLQKLEEMQYESEVNYGAQVPVSLKNVIDSGVEIKKLYADFIGTVRLSKIVKPSMDDFGAKLSDVVEKISSAPQLDHHLY